MLNVTYIVKGSQNFSILQTISKGLKHGISEIYVEIQVIYMSTRTDLFKLFGVYIPKQMFVTKLSKDSWHGSHFDFGITKHLSDTIKMCNVFKRFLFVMHVKDILLTEVLFIFKLCTNYLYNHIISTFGFLSHKLSRNIVIRKIYVYQVK